MDAAAKELKIENLLGRSIFELSGGEKQKIACASVSALRPQVMVLDEPTSNLDLQTIEELKQTLLTWKAEGKTIVIAEHRLSWLKEICDRVICMKDGEVDFDIPMTEFERYSAEQLHKMGLRSLDDNAVPQICSEMIGGETLELRNFCFSYDGVPALHIPQLTLPVGGIIAVVGNNGAGKSTFSRCLCGLEKKFKGEVRINGQVWKKRQLLKNCYMVMQDVISLPQTQYAGKQEEITAVFDGRTSVAVLEGGGVIVTAPSLLKAYDRLEVAEYSARAILESSQLGNIVEITEKQVDEIRVQCHLN